jgi:hypothetical protein
VNPTPVQTSVRRAARRVTALTSLGLVAAVTLLTTPAEATGTPEGWSNPEKVDPAFAMTLLVGGPILLFVLIAFFVYAPALARGERIAPGAAEPENEWFGGPRQGVEAADKVDAKELEGKQTGGASGRW